MKNSSDNLPDRMFRNRTGAVNWPKRPNWLLENCYRVLSKIDEWRSRFFHLFPSTYKDMFVQFLQQTFQSA